MNLKDIEDILRKHKPVLQEKYKVKEIGVFGSYVRGEQSKISDIDILVQFSEWSKQNIGALQCSLSLVHCFIMLILWDN